MAGLGVLLLIIWLVAKLVGVVIDGLLDIAVFIIVVGFLVDLVLALTGRATIYSRFRR